MKTTIAAAVAFALLAATGAQAQNASTSDPNAAGQSVRCDTMTGAERDQCLRDENAKTQNAPADSSNASTGADSNASTGADSSASTGSDSSASGASAPASGDASSSAPDKGSQDTAGDKLPATKSE